MRYIVVEDEVYSVTEEQFLQIKKVDAINDENAMIEFFEKHKPEYKLLGYVSFSFRE